MEHRNHGYCCNACKDGRGHTNNCTGHRDPWRDPPTTGLVVAQNTGPNRAPTRLGAFYHPWPSPGPTSPEALSEHVYWFGRNYGTHMGTDATDSWHRLIQDWQTAWNPRHTQEPPLPVTVYALSRDRWTHSSARVACPSVDVHALGLDGNGQGYSMRDVTGFDFRVQGRLVQQALFPDILRQAMLAITRDWDSGRASHYAFVCSHGTHRSVGCAVLTAQLLCPSATIVVGTPRTHDAAAQAGFLPSSTAILPF